MGEAGLGGREGSSQKYPFGQVNLGMPVRCWKRSWISLSQVKGQFPSRDRNWEVIRAYDVFNATWLDDITKWVQMRETAQAGSLGTLQHLEIRGKRRSPQSRSSSSSCTDFILTPLTHHRPTGSARVHLRDIFSAWGTSTLPTAPGPLLCPDTYLSEHSQGAALVTSFATFPHWLTWQHLPRQAPSPTGSQSSTSTPVTA